MTPEKGCSSYKHRGKENDPGSAWQSIHQTGDEKNLVKRGEKCGTVGKMMRAAGESEREMRVLWFLRSRDGEERDSRCCEALPSHSLSSRCLIGLPLHPLLFHLPPSFPSSPPSCDENGGPSAPPPSPPSLLFLAAGLAEVRMHKST